jgi:hypothetical protein
MEIVYKFCSKYGLEILRNLELKVTPPNQLNDPFEFTPNTFCSDAAGYAKRIFEHGIDGVGFKKFYDYRHSRGKYLGTFREFQEKYKDKIPTLIAMLAKAPQDTSPLHDKSFLDEVSKQYGILCLSQRRDKILMWGHYCDMPLGLVIGFDKSSAIFRLGNGLRPVIYVQTRVVCDQCWEVGSPELLNYENEIIFHKNADWAYEAESRQLFALSSSSLSKKPLKDENRTLGYFIPFPPEAIVSVTLGPRNSPELENEVREILQKPCFAHVKLDHAVLHKSAFVLEFE